MPVEPSGPTSGDRRPGPEGETRTFFDNVLPDAARQETHRLASPPSVRGYTIVEELGRGGMGTVYRARQDDLGREVALKVLRDASGNPSGRIARFGREARAIARLSHPGIVQIYEVGSDGDVHFISMEYLRGRPLDEVVRDGPVPFLRATRIVRDMARALDYAHGRGVLHRDIKPSNVIVDAEGAPTLTDFGLAKIVDPDLETLTRADALLGTPYYLPPEAVDQSQGGRSFDELGDVYSLGVVYYQLLAGRLPFRAESFLDLVRQILTTDVPPPSRHVRAVTPAIDRACARAMARSRDGRFATAAALADELTRILDDPTARPARRPASWKPAAIVAGAVVLVALGAGLGVLFSSGRSADERPPDGPPAPDEAAFEAAMAEATAAEDAGRIEAALAAYERALAAGGDRPETYLRRGQLHLGRGEPARAAADLETALRLPGLGPERRGRVLIDLGLARWLGGDQEVGLALTADGLLLLPDDLVGLRNQTSFLIEVGRLEEARPVLHRGLMAYPEDRRLHQLRERLEEADPRLEEAYRAAMVRARAARDANDLDGILTRYGEVIRLFPDRYDTVEAYIERAGAFFQRRRTDDARRELARALTIDGLAPSQRATVLGNLALVEFQAGDQQEALDRVDEALALDDRSALLLTYKGRMLMDLGRPAEARLVLVRLVQLHPDDPGGRALLAEADRLLGR